MTAVGNRETGRETWSQVCERPRAAGADTWERAESRSVTQETEHEINEHMGAGVVTFQEGSEGGGKSLWERSWGLRGWSRWEEVGHRVSFLVLGTAGRWGQLYQLGRRRE